MKLRPSTLVMALAILYTGCDQDSVNGSLLVRLKSNGHVISQSTVYIKAGSLTNPKVVLAEYDFTQRADGIGDAYFDDLAPGEYYIHARGYDQDIGGEVLGDSSITIIPVHRQNRYEVTVIAKQ